ncbi:unnamed protein product [Miscanthus lutarioriparius]|uniref:Uncharacterized protein n=1 Tax=Miscanthus lutarioriparius TaxID=422564 RepID=A0A811S5G5_9POAL|nr:unnamed protein product [Miscanthus lutarioriparius]
MAASSSPLLHSPRPHTQPPPHVASWAAWEEQTRSRLRTSLGTPSSCEPTRPTISGLGCQGRAVSEFAGDGELKRKGTEDGLLHLWAQRALRRSHRRRRRLINERCFHVLQPDRRGRLRLRLLVKEYQPASDAVLARRWNVEKSADTQQGAVGSGTSVFTQRLRDPVPEEETGGDVPGLQQGRWQRAVKHYHDQEEHRKKATRPGLQQGRGIEADEVTVGLRAVGFSKGVVLKQRQRMHRKRRLGEEERAAILLMALSGGRILVSPSRGVVYDFIMLLPSSHLAGVRGFVINDHMEFPRYLSFVKGVVDSNGLPLNVSREILQESRI